MFIEKLKHILMEAVSQSQISKCCPAQEQSFQTVFGSQSKIEHHLYDQLLTLVVPWNLFLVMLLHSEISSINSLSMLS